MDVSVWLGVPRGGGVECYQGFRSRVMMRGLVCSRESGVMKVRWMVDQVSGGVVLFKMVEGWWWAKGVGGPGGLGEH